MSVNTGNEETERKVEIEPAVIQYINEQTEKMAQDFLSYVCDNEMELAANLESQFFILTETSKLPDQYSKYSIPTGRIYIRRETIITKSEEFYFRKVLCTITQDAQGNGLCITYTKWCKIYLELFKKTLQQKIAEAFAKHPDFKVSFTDNNHFELELI